MIIWQKNKIRVHFFIRYLFSIYYQEVWEYSLEKYLLFSVKNKIHFLFLSPHFFIIKFMQKVLKKIPKKTIDFFSLYRSNQFRKYFLSGSIAIFTAFSIVSVFHGNIDMWGLMASVANVSEVSQFDADLILRRQWNNISLIFGAHAKKVDKIDLTILSDPTRFHSLKSTSNSVRIVWDTEMGAYHLTIDMSGKDIVPGTYIADLIGDIDAGTPIALTDTYFMSLGKRYSLSSKWE